MMAGHDLLGHRKGQEVYVYMYFSQRWPFLHGAYSLDLFSSLGIVLISVTSEDSQTLDVKTAFRLLFIRWCY